jgi:RND family efflux transporter MFP subunit
MDDWRTPMAESGEGSTDVSRTALRASGVRAARRRAGRRLFAALTVCGLWLVSASISACDTFDDNATEDATPTIEATLPPVRSEGVVEAQGKVVPVHRATLAFAVGGAVSKVLVSEGDTARVGDILIRLDSAAQGAAVLQATADRAAAEAQLEVAEADAASMSGGNLDAASQAATAAVNAARARLDQTQAALEQAMVQLDRTELRAPFDGRVAAVHVAPGEVAIAGAPIVDLADDASWLVETDDLTELDVVGVRAGDAATLTFDALPDVKLPGIVVAISPMGEVRLGDVVYRVTVRPDAHEPRLRWNMTATVRIEVEPAD